MKEPGCRVGKIRVQIQRRQTKSGKAEKRSHWSLLTSSSTPTAVPRSVEVLHNARHRVPVLLS
jgi:hypothetical protein